jgi:serine/threonine protein kinase
MNEPTVDRRMALLRGVDDVCLQFEDRCKAGERPAVEELLADFPAEGRADLLGELLLLEWDYRGKAGESFTLEEYARRFEAWRGVVEQHWRHWGERSSYSTVPPGESLPLSDRSTIVGCGLPGYERQELLGKGGMGEVYRAFDPRLKRWVALKQVLLDQVTSLALSRFRLEAEALARLAHPHIVKLHGQADWDGRPVLEMEYVPGGTLEERLRRGPLAPAEAGRLVAVLAWAVQAAHDKGIVHRDLKPANVLMDEPVAGNAGNVLDGFPKISDFGLAALAGESVGQGVPGNVVGTPAYMAPEQAEGRMDEVGPKADVWALGVILYRCLTGVLPFAGDSVHDTLERVKSAPVQPLRELRPEVEVEWEEVCLACLDRVAARRPTAAELAQRLDRLTGRSGTAAAPRPRSRAGWLVVAAALAAVLVVVVAARWWWVDQFHEPKVTLRVLHWERDEGKDFPVGPIHADSEVRWEDRVVIDAELSRPAYCYLIAYNADGKEQLLWPCDEGHPRNPGDASRAPPRRARVRYPPPPRPGPDGSPGRAKGLSLNDEVRGGMQAFVVVASRRPLPAFEEWKRQRGSAPWQRHPAAKGVWASDGITLDRVDEVGARKRGEVVELEGQPPLLSLCGWARGQGKGVVEAMAFPVFRRGGEQ